MKYVALLTLTILSLLGAAEVSAEVEKKPIGILVAAGDISTCGSDEGWKKYADRTAGIAKSIIEDAKGVPVKVLALGDLAYETGLAEEFECFAKHWSGLDKYILPVPGNHEYMTPGAKPFFDFFKDNIAIGQNGAGKGYFALLFPDDGGPWTLIGLNAHLKGSAARKEQHDWLKTALEAVAKSGRTSCVLAFWHAPTFSSGKHGHGYSPKKSAPLDTDHPMQAEFRMLQERGASVVLAGHDHDYEQFVRHDADGKPATDGIRSFVVGTGGKC